jgi:hypothetical protein
MIATVSPTVVISGTFNWMRLTSARHEGGTGGWDLCMLVGHTLGLLQLLPLFIVRRSAVQYIMIYARMRRFQRLTSHRRFDGMRRSPGTIAAARVATVSVSSLATFCSSLPSSTS